MAGLSLALGAVSGRVRLLMELTAGSGTALGSTFEEMAMLVGAIRGEHQSYNFV